jgi:hypothetical protein
MSSAPSSFARYELPPVSITRDLAEMKKKEPAMPKLFVIEYTPCPTSQNSSRKMTTDNPSTSLVYASSSGDLLVLKSQTNVVVDLVYVLTETQKEVHYKDRGYNAPHLSEELKALIKRPLNEVLM